MLSIQKKLSNAFYVILGLPATAMGFALSVQIAVLSWILRTKFGFEIHHIGFVWAAGPLAGILGQPIIGMISDKVWFLGGRRRPFIIIGGFLAAFSILALPNIDVIANTFKIGSLVAVAVTVALTLDLSINISFNPTRAIIADVTPEGQARTKGYTWMQSISNLFGALAYLTSALIGNYELIYGGAIVVLIFSVTPLFYIAEPRELAANGKDSETEHKSTQTNWSELFKIYFAHGFSWLGIQTMFVYTIAFLEQKFFTPETYEKYIKAKDMIAEKVDASTLAPDLKAAYDTISTQTGSMTGWSFFLLNFIGFFIPILVLEPLTKKIGQVRTHYLAIAIMALGYFGIANFASNATTLYLLMAVLSIGWSAVVSLPFSIMSENVDQNRMGFFMGIFNLSVVLPQLIVSSFFGSIIVDTADKSIVYWISAISLAISAVLWMFVKETRKKQNSSS